MFPFWKLGRLVGKGAAALVSLALARRRAIRGFRAGLEEMDVPPEVVDRLVQEYPSFDLRDGLGNSARDFRGSRR